MYRGGFNLRKWNSDSSELLERIRQCERDLVLSTDLDKRGELKESSDLTNGVCKLLGNDWYNLRDDFIFEFSELIQFVSKLP